MSVSSLIQSVARPIKQAVCVRCIFGFDNNANHRLRVGSSHMYPTIGQIYLNAVRQIIGKVLELDRDPKVLQHRIEAIRFHSEVVLQHEQSGKLVNDVRDGFARARQAFENKSYRGGAVVGQMDLRNRHAAAALAAEDGVMFKHGFGDVSLSDLGAHNASSMERGDSFYSTGGRNIRNYHPGALCETNAGGQGQG